MMTKWKNKHLVILGAARQGLALAEYLASQGVQITLTDQKNEETLGHLKQNYRESEINWALGGHPLELLDSADGLALSGGVPLDIPFVQEARSRGIPLTNDSQEFLELAPCPVIGITGSAGKTTTTLLVGKIAAAALGEDRTWVGGNIGNPLIRDLEDMQEDHLAVIELSSFQTELLVSSPEVACVLNITPNHLDRHGTMEAYTKAKKRLLDFQHSSDTAVLNREDPVSWGLRGDVRGTLVSFGRQLPADKLNGTFIQEDWICYQEDDKNRRLVPLSSIQLRGRHNQLNVLAACAVAAAAGLPDSAMQPGVESLTGVEHRLELVRTWQGVTWINDSIATAPERSIAALNSFQEPIVLLAGGKDKDLPWDEFAQVVLKQVKAVVLFGDAADLIAEALDGCQEENEGPPCWKTAGLQGAIEMAAKIAEPGDVVLLSPGGTSFDEFSDFAERGRKFRKWVSELN